MFVAKRMQLRCEIRREEAISRVAKSQQKSFVGCFRDDPGCQWILDFEPVDLPGLDSCPL